MIEKFDIPTLQLLNIIYDEYGYDFASYSIKHVNRRITDWMEKNDMSKVLETMTYIKTNRQAAMSLISHFSIGITEMFRDPLFYKSFRKNVIPLLRTYPFIKIWHAGCSTGEEVYSLAIMLKEEGLLHKSRLYGTDFNDRFLSVARKGVYSYDNIKRDTSNYNNTGSNSYFSSYYRSQYNSAIMNSELKDHIVWANHNLVADKVFNEVDVIFCRNVFIYFNKALQNKVLELFIDSLSTKGILCLGGTETLLFTSVNSQFIALDRSNCVYRLLK
jgi:chemotaxis protein methyltransferase CheR